MGAWFEIASPAAALTRPIHRSRVSVDFRLTQDKKRSGYRCIRTVFYRELAAAATATAVVISTGTTTAVAVVIAQQDQNNDEKDPGAVTAAEQIVETHDRIASFFSWGLVQSMPEVGNGFQGNLSAYRTDSNPAVSLSKSKSR